VRWAAQANVTEEDIRTRIRRMLKTGDLECDDAGRVWAGESSGKRCAACLEAIVPSDVEFEVVFNGRTLYFHPPCHQIWLEECESDTTKRA